VEFAAPLVRLLLYTGATLSIGRGVHTVLDGDADRETDGTASTSRPVRSALWVGAIALIVAPLALVALQQRALELPAADVPGLLRDTTWGRGWTRLAIPSALAAVLLPLRPSRTTSALLLMAALGVAAAMGGLGHAAADEQWPLASRVFDALHVAGVGAWIGGLLLLVLGSVGSSTPTASQWRAFSRTATIMAPVVVLSGVGSSWRRVGASGPAAILASDYGRLLLLKIALTIVVMAMGYTQRRRIAAGQTPVRPVVLREVVLATVALGATAWMTGTEPPGE
jgi:putative copper export protein